MRLFTAFTIRSADGACESRAHLRRCPTSRRLAIGALLAAGTAFSLAEALAQDAYPSKPITLVVAFAPGTGTDLLARLVANKLSEQLGQNIVVDNRSGAGGLIGTNAVAKAAPDGYTLTLGTNATLITSPLLSKSPPYQAAKDFVPIGTVARTPMVIVTGTGADAPKTFKEMVSRARTTKTSFASAGVGTIGHLTSEVVVKSLGLEANHVPYKGSGQSLTDVARGEVLFATDTPAAALPLISSGRLRPLAVTGERRLQALPGTPTLSESGVPDIKLSVWWGVLAPTGTPAAAVERLRAGLAKVVANPDLRKRMQEMELEPLALSGPEFGAFIRAEYPFWQRFLSQAAIKLE